MQEVSGKKVAAIVRISGIVDNLIKKDSLFHKLDKAKMIQIFSNLLNKLSPEEANLLDDEEITKRVEGVMVVEAMSHLLDDLTPEQKERFFAAVEGR
jgi:hypothetical protein